MPSPSERDHLNHHSLQGKRAYDADPCPLRSACRLARTLLEVAVAVIVPADPARPAVVEGSDPALRLPDAAFWQRIAPGHTLAVVPADAHTARPRHGGGEIRAGFLAALPLILDTGRRVGTLGLADPSRRVIGARERRRLAALGADIAARVLDDESRADLAGRAVAAEQATQAAEERYRLLEQHISDLIILADLDTTRRYVSPSVERILGFAPTELVGKRMADQVRGDQAEKLCEMLRRGEGAGVTNVRQYLHKDGSLVWLEGLHQFIRDPASGHPTSYIVALRDITQRKTVEDQLVETTDQLNSTLENMDQGLVMFDPSGAVRVHNRRALDLLQLRPRQGGATASALRRALVGKLGPCGRLPPARGAGPQAVPEGKHLVVGEMERPGGVTLEVRTVALPDGATVVTLTDVSARKAAETLAEHLARHDGLTALANRRGLREQLDRAVRRLEGGSGGRYAIVSLDLDGFKAVNDRHGHPAGDALLVQVAERLLQLLEPDDFVARLGGDEFVCLLADPTGARAVDAFCQEMVDRLSVGYEVLGERVAVGVSAGVSFAPQDGRTADDLLKNADSALYRAKAAGRATYRFFSADADRKLQDCRELMHDLRSALARDEFRVVFQPYVDATSRRMTGCEALLRWHHPRRGLVSPADFIPLAEESGVIVELGAWVLEQACHEAAQWADEHRVSVNISPVQFRDRGLPRLILRTLTRAGLSPSRLEIEITEAVLIEDGEGALDLLRQIRALGVRVALDDFGTGYSSLSYLRRFPFDRIKIDRCFVQEVKTRQDSQVIVKAIRDLATGLGMTITAEGVETAEQAEQLVLTGCEELQGFLFSRPAPPEQLGLRLGRVAPRLATGS